MLNKIVLSKLNIPILINVLNDFSGRNDKNNSENPSGNSLTRAGINIIPNEKVIPPETDWK